MRFQLYSAFVALALATPPPPPRLHTHFWLKTRLPADSDADVFVVVVVAAAAAADGYGGGHGQTSHRAEALFEFTCSGEVSLDLQSGVIEESGQRLSGQQQGFAGATSSHSASSSSDTPYAGSNIKSKGDSSSGDSSGAYSSSSSSSSVGRDRDDSWASVSLAAMYPSAFPRVMPSGCAFEARLDDADFEPVPNAVTLTGLSNGDHRFSVK